jgi:chemotaxis protein CheC
MHRRRLIALALVVLAAVIFASNRFRVYSKKMILSIERLRIRVIIPPCPMRLTPKQKDILTELVNIGYARAAGALSDLTGHRITLAVPDVKIYPIDRITPLLQEVVEGEVTCVNQLFGGDICGNAALLFDTPAALILTELLTNRPRAKVIDDTGREVLTEVGNILLNACLGTFGNLLKTGIKFTVPELKVDQVAKVLRSFRIHDKYFDNAMMIRTRFYIRASNVSGFLVILMSVTSLKHLVENLSKIDSFAE